MFSWLRGSKNKKSIASPKTPRGERDRTLPTPRAGTRPLQMERPLTTREAAKEVTMLLDAEQRERQRALRDLLRKLPPEKTRD